MSTINEIEQRLRTLEYKKLKHQLQRMPSKVEPWRCPGCGCKIEYAECLECRIEGIKHKTRRHRNRL